MLGYLSLILVRSLLTCSIDLIPPLPILQSISVSVFYRQSDFVSHDLETETGVKGISFSNSVSLTSLSFLASDLPLKANLVSKARGAEGTSFRSGPCLVFSSVR